MLYIADDDEKRLQRTMILFQILYIVVFLGYITKNNHDDDDDDDDEKISETVLKFIKFINMLQINF